MYVFIPSFQSTFSINVNIFNTSGTSKFVHRIRILTATILDTLNHANLFLLWCLSCLFYTGYVPLYLFLLVLQEGIVRMVYTHSRTSKIDDKAGMIQI